MKTRLHILFQRPCDCPHVLIPFASCSERVAMSKGTSSLPGKCLWGACSLSTPSNALDTHTSAAVTESASTETSSGEYYNHASIFLHAAKSSYYAGRSHYQVCRFYSYACKPLPTSNLTYGACFHVQGSLSHRIRHSLHRATPWSYWLVHVAACHEIFNHGFRKHGALAF